MGTHQPLDPRRRLAPLAAAVALAFGVATAVPALAQEEGAAPKRDKVMELLEKLKDKGIISEEEFNELTDNTPEGRAAARAERRARVQREALDAQKAEQARERLNGRWNNGLSFETPDRRTSFTLGGRVHTDYRNYDAPTQADTVDIRRAYLTLQGKWNEWVTWDLTGDFAQSGVALDVAWVNAALNDKVQIRMGQFKMPFSLEELTSSRFIDFQERSMANVLVPAKERGFMIHGLPLTGTTYGIAVSNGQGKNGNDTVQASEGVDLIGRATVNVAELLGRRAIAVGHLGIAGSVGEQPAGARDASRLSFRNNENRGITFFRTDAFTGDAVQRKRLGLEAAIAYGPFKLQGETVTVNYSGKSAAGADYDRSIDSYYIGALWMITGERYAETYRNGVFGRMTPISSFEPGGSGWGAWELGVRFSQFDATDFKTTNAAGTGRLANFSVGTDGSPTTIVTTNKATSTTLALKWIWNPNFRWYLNYVITHYDTPITVAPGGYGGQGNAVVSKENTIMLRGAFDW